MVGKFVIDCAFIEKWHPLYDCPKVGNDEKEYKDLIDDVAEVMSQTGTISEVIFKKIYNWKAARALHYVDLTKFDNYKKVIKQATAHALENPEKTLNELDNLNGIGIPVASTILHFIYPKVFPVVDFRTIEVLQAAGYLDKSISYYRDSSRGYSDFRRVILDIAQKYSKGDIRKVDKALFAYHKLNLNNNKFKSL